MTTNSCLEIRINFSGTFRSIFAEQRDIKSICCEPEVNDTVGHFAVYLVGQASGLGAQNSRKRNKHACTKGPEMFYDCKKAFLARYSPRS